MLDHGRKGQDRKGQYQHKVKSFPEVIDHSGMMTMASIAVMTMLSHSPCVPGFFHGVTMSMRATITAILRGVFCRNQIHPALRTFSGSILDYFGMHGTGVFMLSMFVFHHDILKGSTI
jgi:hypothetical protein